MVLFAVDAEVVSLDVLTKEPHGVIVGVALIKVREGSPQSRSAIVLVHMHLYM